MRRRRCHINVNQATPTITWATPAAITYGTALSSTQLNATASVAGHAGVQSGSGHGAECRARPDVERDVDADAIRWTTRTATATVSINVNQATPTITWATPADITYGTALSSTQLECDAVGGGHAGVQSGSGNRAECRCTARR